MGVHVLSTTDRVRGHQQIMALCLPAFGHGAYTVFGKVRKMRLEIAVKSEQE